MNKIVIVFGFLILAMHAISQSKPINPTGEFYLEGVMETASGILIKPDSSFEFFYSYGALDRGGKGKWTIRDGMLILQSKSRPEKDFALIASRKEQGNGTTIKIVEKNTMILHFIQCAVKTGSGNISGQSDRAGYIKLEQSGIDNLSLVFTLCAERQSNFDHLDKSHNYFEFRFEPWICDLFFDELEFKIDETGLIGEHPLLNGKNFRYRRAGQ